MEGVERDVVVRSRGARRDRDVRDRGHRWRDRDVLLGHDAVGLETAESGPPIEDTGFQIVLDEVRLSAVERVTITCGFEGFRWCSSFSARATGVTVAARPAARTRVRNETRHAEVMIPPTLECSSHNRGDRPRRPTPARADVTTSWLRLCVGCMAC